MKVELERLGLDEKEAAVYSDCFRRSMSTPALISRSTGLKRSTVYFYLDKLQKRGFIGMKVIKKRKYIVVTSPDQALGKFLRSREEELENVKEQVSGLIKRMEKIYQEKQHSTELVFYEGKEGLKIMMNKILLQKSNFFWFGSINYVLSIVGEDYFYKKFTLERMKSNTSAYAITDRQILQNKRFGEQIGNFRFFKFIDEEIKIPALLIVCGENIYLSSLDDHQIKIINIKDHLIADIFSLMFKLLWDQIKA